MKTRSPSNERYSPEGRKSPLNGGKSVAASNEAFETILYNTVGGQKNRTRKGLNPFLTNTIEIKPESLTFLMKNGGYNGASASPMHMTMKELNK